MGEAEQERARTRAWRRDREVKSVVGPEVKNGGSEKRGSQKRGSKKRGVKIRGKKPAADDAAKS